MDLCGHPSIPRPSEIYSTERKACSTSSQAHKFQILRSCFEELHIGPSITSPLIFPRVCVCRLRSQAVTTCPPGWGLQNLTASLGLLSRGNYARLSCPKYPEEENTTRHMTHPKFIRCPGKNAESDTPSAATSRKSGTSMASVRRLHLT